MTDKKTEKVHSDAEPDVPPVLPPPPEEIDILDERRKYQYVATYHGPHGILEMRAHNLSLLRDVPTDVTPAAADDLGVVPHVTVDQIPLADDEDSPDSDNGQEV